MQIRSEPEHGTAVRLFFPRVGTPQASAAPSVSQQATPAGSETILVVEDDVIVRGYVEGELKALGYRVIVTSSAPRRSIYCAGLRTSTFYSPMS
jgi:hypothetical protein